LGLYFQSASANSIYSHLYGDWDCEFALEKGAVKLSQRTEYPYDGRIATSVSLVSPFKFDLLLRIPSWAAKWSVKVNGKKLSRTEVVKGYLKLSREWRDGDEVELSLSMEPVAIEAHPAVRHDAGRVALMRGPLVYCLEEADNGKDLNDLQLDLSKPLKMKMDGKLFGGTPVIEGVAMRSDLKDWKDTLYRPAGTVKARRVKFKAIPYNRWANRGPGEMLIWARASR